MICKCGYERTPQNEANHLYCDFLDAPREPRMTWIPVTQRLPVIPEGKYGVHVLVAMFDAVFEELNPGHGYHVMEYGFFKTVDRHGNKHIAFEHTDIDEDFFEFDKDGNAHPSGDPITHWMYKPEPPKAPTK